MEFQIVHIVTIINIRLLPEFGAFMVTLLSNLHRLNDVLRDCYVPQ